MPQRGRIPPGAPRTHLPKLRGAAGCTEQIPARRPCPLQMKRGREAEHRRSCRTKREGRERPLCIGSQEVWCGPRRQFGAFLHSPMLDELKSLQTMLATGGSGGSAAGGRTPHRTVSVELSGETGDSERVDLPMLPSLEHDASVSQHYELQPPLPDGADAKGSANGNPQSPAAEDKENSSTAGRRPSSGARALFRSSFHFCCVCHLCTTAL